MPEPSPAVRPRRAVLVTRPAAAADRTAEQLRAMGFEPILAPLLAVRPQPIAWPDRLDAILVTSGNAIAALSAAPPVPILVVGDGTAERAREAGLRGVESAAGDAAALLDLARTRLKPGSRVLLASGEGQGGTLAEGLRQAGFRVQRRVAYAALPVDILPAAAEAAIRDGGLAAVLFLSADTARVFVRLLPPHLVPNLRGVEALAIAEGAAKVLAPLPWRRVRVSVGPTLDQVLALLMTDDLPTDPAHSTESHPPERARIEPSAPPKRLDALPILYLAGFLILAGSLIYIWRHPTLPTGVAQQVDRVDTLRQEADSRQQELSALTARLTQLEARPVAAPADLGPLDTRLKALETRPAPAAPDLTPVLAPVLGRIAALEARPLPPPPADLAPLQARIAAVEARKPVDLTPVETRLGAAEKRDGEIAAKVDALDPRLAATETLGRQTAAGLAAITDRAQRSQRVIAATAALDAGQSLGDIPGAPASVAQFAHAAPPTMAALRLSFNGAAEAAHRASQPAITDNQPFLDRMWTRAQQSVTVRQGERVIVGDPIAGVIAGAQGALEAGDLSGAVKALSGLSGPAKAAMADWIGRAQSLLDARAGLAEMAAR